jgi:hypothetical protein
MYFLVPIAPGYYQQFPIDTIYGTQHNQQEFVIEHNNDKYH